MSATPTNGHADSENIGNGQGGFKGKARDYATGAGLRGDEGVVYGSPRQHTTGVFAGKVMRFGLDIAQQPLLGRKFGEKDRRPLAHSPICRLFIKHCHPAEDGTWVEEDVDVQHIETTAFICSVDLFTPAVPDATGNLQRSRCTHVYPGKARADDGRAEKRFKSFASRNLFGNLNVTAIRVAAPEGGMGMWFIFSDVCVRHEGSYSLRFRVFDLSSLSAPPVFNTTTESIAIDAPIAESFSNIFRVYSPRTFPGLPKTQTALSEHFSRQGFKLNVRKGPSRDHDEHEDTGGEGHRPQPVPLQNHGPVPLHGISSGSTQTSSAAGVPSDGSIRRMSTTSSTGLIPLPNPSMK